MPAAAASYYRAALRGDPRNNELLNRAFLAVLANGEVDEAVKLAERVLQADKNDRIARLVLGVRAIKQKQYAVARQQLAQSVRGPITDLAAALLSAWTQATPAESKAAVDAIDKLAGPEWYSLFKNLHAGLILELRRPEARGRQALRSAPTSSMRRSCASCRPMAAICRARATRTKRSRSTRPSTRCCRVIR